MEQVIGYPGQQIQISHSFKNPDNTQSQITIAGAPVFRVTSPEGQVVVDSTYHSTAGQDLPDGVLPGQVFSSGAGRWSLLWSIPEDATLGGYRVEVSASVNGYGLVEEVGVISVRPAWRLSVEGSARRRPKETLAYSCWFQVSTATTIRLNRGIWQMIQADQVRRPVSPGGIFARGCHEDGSEIDLLPLTSLTLQPGWTRVTVSTELFMVPAVDRLYQPVGYSSSADRYANPYYRDQTVYTIEGAQTQSPFAYSGAFGPGPLFYLYLNDPHWGCRDFKTLWTQNGRLQADPTSSAALTGRDPRRLELVCSPDFRNKVDFYGMALPARQVTSAEHNSLVSPKDYAVMYDGARIWLDYNPNGPDGQHGCLAPEMSSGGPSDYYRMDTEVVRQDPADGSPNRFMISLSGWDGKTPYKDPGTLIHL